MHLQIFDLRIGQDIYELHAYPFFLNLALLVAVIGTLRVLLYMKVGITRAVISIGLMGLMAFVTARVFYCILYYETIMDDLFQAINPSFSGYTLYGGVFGSILCTALLAKIWKIDFWQWMDRSVGVVTLASATARIGCFINGCCFGKVTKLPFGIPIKEGSLAHRAYITQHPLFFFGDLPKIHPTQLYELVAVIIAYVAAMFYKRKHKQGHSGMVALIFGIVWTIGRLTVFFFRDFPYTTDLSNMIRGPFIYGGTLMICIFMIYLHHKIDE